MYTEIKENLILKNISINTVSNSCIRTGKSKYLASSSVLSAGIGGTNRELSSACILRYITDLNQMF